MRLRTAGAAAILSLAISGAGAAVATPAFADTPTVTVNPSSSLADGQEITVALTGFTPGDNVAVVECTQAALASQSPNDCDTTAFAGGPVGSDGTENVDFTALTWNYSDANGGTCSPGGQCVIVAEDLTNAAEKNFATISFAPAPALGANPDQGLKDGQLINTDVTGLTAAANGSAYVVECDSAAVNYQSDPNAAEGYCDLGDLGSISPDANGNGTGTFTVAAGNNYVDSHHGKCDANNACYLAAVSSDFSQFAFTPITFDQSVVTKTTTRTTIKVKGKLIAGKKVTVKALTGPASSSLAGGTMTIKANGKKIAKVAEPASGKVSATFKLRKGKNKIQAVYSGDASNTPSGAATTVKAKK